MSLEWFWDNINAIAAVGGVTAAATVTYSLYRLWRARYYKDEYFRSVKRAFKEPKSKIILVIGLEGSGKSCFLTSFGESRPINRAQPTTFMTRRTVTINNTEFTLYEVKQKSQWPKLLNVLHIKTVVLVVDSSDHARLENVKQELTNFSQEVNSKDSKLKTKDVQLLVVANKQDIPGALKPQEVLQRVMDNSFTYKDVQVVGTTVGVGKTRTGVFDAFKYLS